MTTIDDPFALPAESRVTTRDSILSRGRYMLPQLDGTHKKRGYMRVSNLVSAYADQFGLRLWELGEVLQGVALEPKLYSTLLDGMLSEMSKEDRAAWVTEFIEHAKEASGGNRAAKHGNAMHAMVEGHHMGLPAGHLDASSRRSLALYESALIRHQLRALPGMQERRVLVEELEVVGTLDNIVEDIRTLPYEDRGRFPCDLYVADLKTQRKFWSWLEVAAQQACYNHADAMWDSILECWVDMPPVRRDAALLLWMPRETDDGEPRVDVWEVDTEAGWATAQNAYRVVLDRAAAKRVTNPRGRLRPAPLVTETERMAARFAGCETLAEGRALVAESQRLGIWSQVLADCAQKARDRIGLPA